MELPEFVVLEPFVEGSLAGVVPGRGELEGFAGHRVGAGGAGDVEVERPTVVLPGEGHALHMRDAFALPGASFRHLGSDELQDVTLGVDGTEQIGQASFRERVCQYV